jgi:predicted ATPase
MLKRIRIQGYKSLVDVEVELKPLSVLIGANAAGKSNFLDALQLLSRLATSRTLKDAFEPPYRGKPLESFGFNPGGLEQLLRQESACFSIEADIELSPNVIDTVNRHIFEMKKRKPSESNNTQGTPSPITASESDEAEPRELVREKNLRYKIEIEILPKSGILRVNNEYLAAMTSRNTVTKSRQPFIEVKNDQLHLRMEGQAHPYYYERYLDHSILSEPLYPPHYPHLVALRQELSRYYFFYFEPRVCMRAPNPVKEVRHIGLMGEELAAFLNTLRALDERQFEAIKKALHMIVPSVTGIDVEVNSLGEVDLWLKEGNLKVPARVVSEGTLRILGLLALSGAKDPPALVGFEEPENGVHPRRIAMIADHLRTRALSGDSQVIVTTHSPILADLIPCDSLFVCSKGEMGTEIKPTQPLFRQGDINKSLEEQPTTSERIMRGDFDA